MFLYWMMLLIPTLVVGGVAIQLLRREKARLAVQSDYAQEARKTAVFARARLVVENVELLIGDVQAALLDTLAEEPSTDIQLFLYQWEKNNPLVRSAFLCDQAGRIIFPASNTADEEARGFVRRISQTLLKNPPWALEIQEAQNRSQLEQQVGTDMARKDISLNIAQVQTARREVQELAKARDYPAGASVLNEALEGRAAEADFAANADRSDGRAVMPAASARSERARESSVSNPSPYLADAKKAKVAEAEIQAKSTRVDRRGWTTIPVDGRLHLIGWVESPDSMMVRGVELELAAMVSRLGGALPAEIATDEGYALKDERGRVIHQVGAVPDSIGTATATVPLSDQLLPGWSVTGYLVPSSGQHVDGASFFWTSALLVSLFVAANLSGGFLLLRQARRSELEALQKTSFVANVSHEFKTPLTTIRLYSELLEQGRLKDAKQGGEYLRTIGRETERLTRLVNNALDFSRLEQGQKRYAPERLDLAVELNRLVQTHSPRVEEAGLTLRTEIPSTSIQVTTDRDALEQIVLNLIDNACKYASSGGEVSLWAKSVPEGGAELRVADRGPGVPTEQTGKIFEKFHRVNDSLTAEKAGAGLGLSIARQLAKGLGGELSYESREGGGAVFVLTLP